MCLPFLEPADMAEHGSDEPSSRAGSPDGEGRVSADRLLLHQRLAVRELIDTELSYLRMLRLCASDIRSRLQQVPGLHAASLSMAGLGSWLLRPYVSSRARLGGREGVVAPKSPECMPGYFRLLAMQPSAWPLTHRHLSGFIC